MLYQMMLHTPGDLFNAEQLQVSPKASKYFNTDCNHPSLCSILVGAHLSISSGDLRKNPVVFEWPIKARIDELEIEISDEDATATANLVGRCLHLNPVDRPTAVELLSDPWFDGVE